LTIIHDGPETICKSIAWSYLFVVDRGSVETRK
jgi:hypothetical protein